MLPALSLPPGVPLVEGRGVPGVGCRMKDGLGVTDLDRIGRK